MQNIQNIAIIGKTRTGKTIRAIRSIRDLISNGQTVTIFEKHISRENSLSLYYWLCDELEGEYQQLNDELAIKSTLLAININDNNRIHNLNFDNCQICQALSARIRQHPGSYIFIDEIHALNKVATTYIHQLLTDRSINIVIVSQIADSIQAQINDESFSEVITLYNRYI